MVLLHCNWFFCSLTCIDLENGSKWRINQNKKEKELLTYFEVRLCEHVKQIHRRLYTYKASGKNCAKKKPALSSLVPLQWHCHWFPPSFLWSTFFYSLHLSVCTSPVLHNWSLGFEYIVISFEKLYLATKVNQTDTGYCTRSHEAAETEKKRRKLHINVHIIISYIFHIIWFLGLQDFHLSPHTNIVIACGN